MGTPLIRCCTAGQHSRFPASEVSTEVSPCSLISRGSDGPFQLHLYQQRMYGNWRWAPEYAAGWCCSLWMRKLSVVCGQHSSDDTWRVSGVFSEILTASSERAPLQPCVQLVFSTEVRRMLLDQNFLTRNAGKPRQTDTMKKKNIVSPQCQNFRSKNVTGKSRGSKRLNATCTASCLAQICYSFGDIGIKCPQKEKKMSYTLPRFIE